MITLLCKMVDHLGQSDGRLIVYGDAKHIAGPPTAFRDVGNANPDKILANQLLNGFRYLMKGNKNEQN